MSNDETSSDTAREARLDAIAAARMVVDGVQSAAVADYLAASAADGLELAHAATAFAGSLLRLVPREQADRIMDHLTRAAISEQ